MRARLIPTFVVCALACGCTASVDGQPFGKKFGTAFAIASRASNGLTSEYTVTVANHGDNECGNAKQTKLPDGTQQLVLTIAKNGNALPLSRGTAYVQSGSDEWATVYGCVVESGLCHLAALTEASIEMTSATDAQVAGNFTAKFSDTDSVSGNFAAPLCQI